MLEIVHVLGNLTWERAEFSKESKCVANMFGFETNALKCLLPKIKTDSLHKAKLGI